MENLPVYVYITFIATVLLGASLFYKAKGNSKTFLMGIIGWVLLQSAAGIAGTL